MQTNNTQTREVPVKRAYTVEEIANILRIGKSSAYDLIKQGHFKTVKIGTAIRVSQKSFDFWLDSQND